MAAIVKFVPLNVLEGFQLADLKQGSPASLHLLIEAMKRIVNDEQLRRNLSAAGPQRAALFSWRTTARLTLEALLDAAQNA